MTVVSLRHYRGRERGHLPNSILIAIILTIIAVAELPDIVGIPMIPCFVPSVLRIGRSPHSLVFFNRCVNLFIGVFWGFRYAA